MKRYIILVILVCIGLIGFYSLGMSSSFSKKLYIKPFGNIKTIHGQKFGSEEAFPMPNDTNMIHWDAGYYSSIRDHLYQNKEAADGDNVWFYAFFPAFPFLWKITQVGNVFIILLNALLFFAGAYLIIKALKFPPNHALYFALPSMVIFFIPYTEALNFFFLGWAIYAWSKDKKQQLFLALFASALVRPSFTFLLGAFFANEIFHLLAHRSFKNSAKILFLRITPLVLATLVVAGIQLKLGSPNFWQFYHAQKIWGHELGWPEELKDWSTLGFGINLSILISLLIPLSTILFIKFFNLIRNNIRQIKSEYTFEDQLLTVSMFYFVAIILFVLFFRHGSLHCLFRFTLNTPFALVLVILGGKRIHHIPTKLRWLWVLFSFYATFKLLGTLQFSKEWKMDDLGFFIYFFVLLQILLSVEIPNKIKPYLTAIGILVACYWSAYLFNWYLNDGWIFA